MEDLLKEKKEEIQVMQAEIDAIETELKIKREEMQRKMDVFALLFFGGNNE